MVAFGKWFSRDEIEAVRAYVGEQAKSLIAEDAADAAAKAKKGR